MDLVEEIKIEQGSSLNRPIDNRSIIAKNLGKIKFRKKLSMIHQALFPMIFISDAWRERMPSISVLSVVDPEHASIFYRNISYSKKRITLDLARVFLQNKLQILFITRLGSSNGKAT
jgi:hypothetical protein